jgi:hypothetical protein
VKIMSPHLVIERHPTLQPDRVRPEPWFEPVETRRQNYLRHRRVFSISLSEIPLERAHVSTAASPYWATAFLTIQQGMASAGTENSNAATNKQTWIIYRA